MKKTNGKYVMKLFIAGGAVGLIPVALILKSWIPNDSIDIMANIPTLIIFFILAAFLAYFIIFIFIKDSIWSRSVKKIEKSFASRDFSPTSTFRSNNGMFYIDAPNGKIAAITTLNPFELQIADASIAENVEAHNGAMLGGTSVVSFRFTINGQKWRVPTFTSNRAYSLKSQEVLTALSKADMQVALINEAKQVAKERIKA